MSDYAVVLSTCGSEEEAEAIASTLVEERLAACVNVVPGITSIYRWEGAVQRDEEWLLVAKTRVALVEALIARLRELHSYDIPEAIVLPIQGGNEAYLKWVAVSTASGQTG